MLFRGNILLVGFALLLASCGRAPVPQPVPTPAPPTVPTELPPVLIPLPPSGVQGLSAFSTERVVLQRSQRDAQALPAGITRIDLDAGSDAAYLRLALLPSEGATVALSVYQNEQGVALRAARDVAHWTQCNTAIQPGARVSLVLSSEKPFHVAACGVVPKAPARPDVIVYLIDTLRKDHLGPYRYPLDTSPNIDAFVKDASLFLDLTPMSSWTRPSVATLLTGTMDYTHHALSPEDRLRAGLPSLAKGLAAGGWETRSIITNLAVGSGFGFGADFAWHEDHWQPQVQPDWPGDVEAVDLALESVAGAHGQPLFLYVHTVAPHRDYTPHPDFAKLYMPERFVGTTKQVQLMEELAAYDAEIAFSDGQFGRLVQALKAAGRYDNALIVLVSDHGEQFMEHGAVGHGTSLHFAELGVPLIVKLPGNTRVAAPVRTPVQMADIAPTVLAALGLDVPVAMDGRSLLPLIQLNNPFVPQPTFARLRYGDTQLYMAQTADLKYVYDVTRDESTWFNRAEDPEEHFPLRKPPAGGEELKAFADTVAAKPLPAPGETSPPLSTEERQDLKALGYL